MDNMMKQPSDPPQPRSKDHVQQCIEEMMEFLTKYKEERSADQEKMFDLNAIRIVEHEVDQSEPQTTVESQPLQMKSTVDREKEVQHNRNLVKPHQARKEVINGAEGRETFTQVELSGLEQGHQPISNINVIITSYSSDSENEKESSDLGAKL